MKKKIALIFGITGQDGSYLTEFLLNKNYFVYGVKRQTSLIHTTRIDHIYEDRHLKPNLILRYGDVTDFSNVFKIINKTKPDEIYNLAAQSNVGVSFELAEYTAQTDSIGTLRILEALRILDKKKKIKFYQASTSEMFGEHGKKNQNEMTKFHPRSPYATSKVFSHFSIQNYREAYNMFAVSGILFNHESPLRGEEFITRKISLGLARIISGKQKILKLGNIYAKRDWGYAPEYVEGMYKIMQHGESDSFVLATNKSHTVREFVQYSFNVVGIDLIWEGLGISEVGIDKKSGKKIVIVNKDFFRLAEVDALIGDYTKANKILGWNPKTGIKKMCEIMVESDIKSLETNIKR